MKIVESRRKSEGGKTFSGKVRVTIQGIATNGLYMTDVDSMPSKSLTIAFTTVEEVYELVRSIVKDVEESYIVPSASH